MRKKYLLFLLIALLLVSCGPSLTLIKLDKPVISYEVRDTEYLVTMDCPNPRAKIYYTTDDSDPKVNGTKYEGPFPVQFGNSIITTIKACSVLVELKSEVVECELETPKVSTPEIVFDKTTKLMTITCEDEKAFIYYKLGNGTDSYMEYTGPKLVEFGTTVYAVAKRENFQPSDTAVEMNVSPSQPRVSQPVIKTVTYGISYNSNPSVKASILELTSSDGADIYYTLDGTTPNNKSMKYDGNPIVLFGTNSLKAIAIPKSTTNKNPSEVVSEVINYNYSDQKSIVPTSLSLPSWLPNVVRWDNQGSYYKYTIRDGNKLYFITNNNKLETMDDVARDRFGSSFKISDSLEQSAVTSESRKYEYSIECKAGQNEKKTLITITNEVRNGEDNLSMIRY